MIGSGLKVWFLVAIVVTGVYVLPSVVATFAGSHTLELNKTLSEGERILDLKCGQCHQYIVDEMELENNTYGFVSEAHFSASKNASYMNYVANMTPATSYSNMCKLCHYTNMTVSGAHTVAIVRPCTWSTCHGNSTDYAQQGYYTQAGQVGRKLGNSTEVHSNWFTGLETGDTTNYTSPDGANNVTKSYYACLGCHSHTGIDFSITRLNKQVITINKTGTYTVTAVQNTTSENTTTSVGSQGSKWN